MFTKKPKVSEVKLSRDYPFMYENFSILTQNDTYLFLEKNGDEVYALHFDGPHTRYGGPNDEAHGGHPLAQYGLGFYGLYEVDNSPLVNEIMLANRVHPSHLDSMFSNYKHYIACFKDVKFESVCRNMREITLTTNDVMELVIKELKHIES